MPKCGTKQRKQGTLSSTPALNDERGDERRELYDQGLGDGAIGKALGIDKSSIRRWRTQSGLPSNYPATGRSSLRLSASNDRERRQLYQQGLNDRQMAARLDVSRHSIFDWRKTRHLRANVAPAPDVSDMKRRTFALLRRGVSAQLIIREMGVTLGSIERWRAQIRREQPVDRRSSRLASEPRRTSTGRLFTNLRPDRRTQAFTLYADGLTDKEIASALVCSSSAVWQWRKALSLPPIHKAKRQRLAKRPPAPAITAMSDPLYAQIAATIGFHIAADLRDDAISDIYLAMQEGRLSIADLTQHSRKAVAHVVKDYADPWGNRSLDEEIGDGDGFRMIDLLKDDSSSNWLEEMGATVW